MSQTDFINVLTWSAPQSGPVIEQYVIYRNAALTRRVGTVKADRTLRFKDHNRKEHTVYTYYIVSEDVAGNRSPPAVIVVKP